MPFYRKRKLGTAMMLGAQAMVECLRREGVNTVFGYPGATIAPFYEALAQSGIRHVLTRTEQGAGHAASGYARLSGRPGVCVATSGPGATTLFTAIATAYSDSIPMVAITGQVATNQLGRDVFQEVDTTGAVEPFTKYSFLLKSAADIGRVFKEAFHIASTGRQGPVLIDAPVDVQRERLGSDDGAGAATGDGIGTGAVGVADFIYPERADIRGYKPRYDGHALQVKRVAEAIRAAKRPLLCLGGGVFLSGAVGPARELCERASLPVVSTLMGIGLLPPGHPLYYGMLGYSGGGAANAALAGSDLLILIGARVGDRAITQPSELAGTTVVHVDIDTAEIGKNVGATIPLVGDAARVIAQLLERDLRGEWPDWIAALDALRAKERTELDTRGERPRSVDPVRFVRALSGLLPEGAVYIADVGQNQIWSAKNFCVPGGRFLTTGGMGTMGYSVPAAIGAKLACPERAVLAVCGDGAFQMSMNELATIRQLGLPIKIIVMRNGVLGMVRDLQKRAGAKEFAVDLSGSPDLGLIAAAYGLGYARAERLDGACAAARDMISCDGAFLLEIVVDPDEEN
ncbi:MAG: thiamine pyrophosphate-binding protein [Clostridiales bacterium]|jgi:acetolactate synthase-1/2/3 large subunit|nr:thiamine pyrophosphate-binding protein [Clostridiales bacterium]